MQDQAEHPFVIVDTNQTTDPDPYVGNIYNEWDWVKVGIDEILASVPYLTFRAEDVYALIKNKEAVLWIIQDGFIVTTTEFDQFSGSKQMLLWLAWVKDRGAARGVKHTEFFSKVAKEAGYDSLEIRSSVPELQKYLLDTGWDINTIVYTRPLK